MRKIRSGASIGIPTHTGGFSFLGGWKKTNINKYMKIKKKHKRANQVSALKIANKGALYREGIRRTKLKMF